MTTQYPTNINTIIGPTGSGKDTQADILARKFGYKIIKVGRLVRDASKTNKKIAQSIQLGELADDTFVNKLIVDKITSMLPTDKILLDGFPRHINQAKWLDELLQKNGLSINHAIFIDISDDEVEKRLALRKREDDQADNIKHRLEIFHNQTRLVITHYKELGKLIHIDGLGSVDTVAKRIEEAIK